MKKFRFLALWLSLICIIAFILQLVIPGFTDIFKLSENALTMPWQFLTAIFLHGSVGHLTYNLFALILFGLIAEKIIGSKRFLLLFFISGILANIVSWYWFPNALGASGAIMGIIGMLAILKPVMAVWAFGLILPMFIVAILWIGGSIIGLFGFGEQNIGYLAHLVGILVGLSWGILLRIKVKKRKHDYFYQRKIEIPENLMRRWENLYMGK